MNTLPVGWTSCRVDDVGRVQLGRQRSPVNHSGPHMRPYLRVANVFEDRIDLSDVMEMNFTPEEFEVFQLQPGDILLNEGQSPELVGRPALYNGELPGACFTNSLVRYQCGTGILPRFALLLFRHWLHTGEFRKRAPITTNIAHLGASRFAAMEVPLPPLAEQKRIAEKLDEVLARVNACRDRLRRTPAILKRFRQAVLAAATNGELTREWREERGLSAELRRFSYDDAIVFGTYEFPTSWTEARLAEISDISGGITKDSKKQEESFREIPYLRVANVQRGFLDLSDMKTIRVPPEKYSNLLLKKGDILFNEGGDIDKLGRGWVWDNEIPECTFQNHVFRARLRNPEFEPRFFSYYGNSRGCDYFLAFGKQTTNLASINKSVLSALPVTVPPVDEQVEIVRRVLELFAYADTLEQTIGEAASKCSLMTSSILAKAFRGGLVPQDPSDESASSMLERILSERSVQEDQPKTRARSPREVATT